MKTESPNHGPHDPQLPSADDEAWLAGLEGRPGGGPSHAEGSLLRQALSPDEAAGPGGLPPAWAEIEQRAGMLPSRGAAANARGWRVPMQAALAAALVLGIALPLWWGDTGGGSSEPAARGEHGERGWGLSRGEAQWLSPDPARDAARLLNALEAAGARVSLQQRSSGEFQLDIAADDAVRAAVNAQLAALETGLDAAGRLTLLVLPAGGPAAAASR